MAQRDGRDRRHRGERRDDGGNRPQGRQPQQQQGGQGQQRRQPADQVKILDTAVDPVGGGAYVRLSVLPQTTAGGATVQRRIGLMVGGQVIDQDSARGTTDVRSGTAQLQAVLETELLPDTITVRVFVEGRGAYATQSVRIAEPRLELVEPERLEVAPFPNPAVPGEVTVVAKVVGRDSRPVRDLEVALAWEGGESSALTNPKGEVHFELAGVPRDHEVRGLVSAAHLKVGVVLAKSPVAEEPLVVTGLTAIAEPVLPGTDTAKVVVTVVGKRGSKPEGTAAGVVVDCVWAGRSQHAPTDGTGRVEFTLDVPAERAEDLKATLSAGPKTAVVTYARKTEKVVVRRVAKIVVTHAVDACAPVHQVGVALRDGDGKPIAGQFAMLRDGATVLGNVDESGHTMVTIADVPERGTASVTFDAMGADKTTIVLRGASHVAVPTAETPKWLQPADLNISYDPSDDESQVVTVTIVNENGVGVPGTVRLTRREVITDHPTDARGVVVLSIPVRGKREFVYLNVLGCGVDKELLLRGPFASGNLVAPIDEAAPRPTTLFRRLGRLLREGSR